jgi:hypothetical protein
MGFLSHILICRSTWGSVTTDGARPSASSRLAAFRTPGALPSSVPTTRADIRVIAFCPEGRNENSRGQSEAPPSEDSRTELSFKAESLAHAATECATLSGLTGSLVLSSGDGAALCPRLLQSQAFGLVCFISTPMRPSHRTLRHSRWLPYRPCRVARPIVT